MMVVEYSNRRGEEIFTSSAGSLKCHDILINLIPYQTIMIRQLNKVLMLFMEWLGQWVDAISTLTISISIFPYSSTWNPSLSSELDNFPDRLLLKVNNIFYNSLLSSYCLPLPPRVHVVNGAVIFMFGCRPNYGHLDHIMITVDVDSPCLPVLVSSGVHHIGTEYLGYSVFEGKGTKWGTKEVGLIYTLPKKWSFKRSFSSILSPIF